MGSEDMTATLPAFEASSTQRDDLWEHCRNNLGIARLLVFEGRPVALIRTACHMAVETACRAALSQTWRHFDGDVEHALGSLAAPPELGDVDDRATPTECLAVAETVVAWVAAYLRSEAPGRPWGY
jgi:hypothetical protein